MSETTAAVVSAPTDASATEAAIPATPVQETGAAAATSTPAYTAPVSAKDRAKQALEASFRAREAQAAAATETPTEAPAADAARTEEAATPVVDSQGRKHDPKSGKFLAETGEASDTTAETPLDSTAVSEAETRPSEIRIPLPEALRAQGIADLPATPETEQVLKALVNGYTRRAEVEQVSQKAAALQQENLRLQAQLAAREQWNTQVVDDGTLATYHAIKDVNPEVAEAFLRGKQAELQSVEQEHYQTLQHQAQEQADAAAGQEFSSRVWAATQSWPAEITGLPHFGALFQQAGASYLAALNARHAAGLPAEASEAGYVQYLQSALVNDPQASAVLRQQMEAKQSAERERIAKEAAERERAAAAEAERQRLLAASQRHADRNQLGNIASQVRTGHDSTTPERPDFRGMSPDQVKKTVRAQLLGR